MIAAHRLPRRFSAVLVVLGCLAMAWIPSRAQAGVAWHESYAAAQSASQASQRPVLVIFTASWCEACQHLDSRLWANPEAAALVEACYEPVLVDVDVDPALARRMGISHIPSACVTNANDQLLTTFDLPPTASSFVAQAARALQETAATAVAPSTTIAARFPAAPAQAAAVEAPQQPAATTAPQGATFTAQPAPSQPVEQGSRYADSGSRYTQHPTSSFAGAAAAAAPAAFPGQPPAGSPVPAAHAATTEAPPWLAGAAAGTTPAEAPAAYQQPAQPQPHAAGRPGYSPTPQTAPAAQSGTYAAAPGGYPGLTGTYAGGAGPASTTTPEPTAPPAVDSAAMATDRADKDGEQKSKSSFLSTLQKPFNFMMGSSEEKDEAEPAEGPAHTPSPYPVGLDGYCPVTLAEQAKWIEGRAQWGVQHRGRTYLFAGANEQQRFLANPDRYAPALSGDDVVVAFEAGSQIPGQRRYGVTYQSRIYLFSSLETRSRFAANPQAYASRVRLAESPGAAAAGAIVR